MQVVLIIGTVGVGIGTVGVGIAAQPHTNSAAATCNLGCGILYDTNIGSVYRVVPAPQSQSTTAPRAITPFNDGAMPTAPSASPDGAQVIFHEGNELQIVTVSSGKITTFRPYVQSTAIGAASWSPDGRTIAFALEDMHTDLMAPYGIAVADARTGAIRATWVAAGHDRRDPSWEPDSRHVVASEQERDAQGPYRGLVAADTLTGVSTLVTHDPSHDYNTPVVSPNGRQIAVIRSDRNSSNNAALVVMNSDGSDVRVLQSVGGAGRPAWSPDGTYLAYTTGASTFLIPVSGGTPIFVTNIAGGDLAWSAAGASSSHATMRSFGPGMGVVRGCGVGCGTFVVNGGAYLYRVSAAGGRGQAVTTTGTNRERDIEPSISPDGRSLAYIAAGGASLDIVPLAGGRARSLGDLPFPDSPSWSPNGTAIAVGFNNAAGGYHGIGVLDAASGAELFTYSAVGANPLQPSWTPDGRSLAATETTGSSFGLVLIDLATRSAHAITHDVAHDYFHPQVSPDGRYIAAVRTTSVRAQTGQLWVMDLNGGHGHAIASNVMDDQIAWSPDGESVAVNQVFSIVDISLTGRSPRVMVAHAAQVDWVGR